MTKIVYNKRHKSISKIEKGKIAMARPRKCRKVCHFPQSRGFFPDPPGEGGTIFLTVEEYETIRLIDGRGLSQEECGASMEIARTTVQAIYAQARKKLADALVESRPLEIQGGDYRLCQGGRRDCGGCFKQFYYQHYPKPKGENSMRLAIPYEEGQIFQHFGHTKRFKLYDVEEERITATQLVDAGDQGHGALAGVLHALHTDVLICGGIGAGAQAALEGAGIRFYAGVTGEADRAAEALLARTLAYDPAARCDHHGEHHHHHKDGRDCGGHHCCGPAD